jgi:uncharacterized alkaline shock family protein YloU
MTENQNHRLPCGTQLALLIEQVADAGAPHDAQHQQTCPHCQRALAELRDLWEHVRAIASEEASAPIALVRRVLRRIRREISRPATRLPLEQLLPRLLRYALLPTTSGETKVADTVVAAIATEATLDVEGVHILTTHNTPTAIVYALTNQPTTNPVTVTITGGRVSIELHIIAAYGINLPTLTHTIRNLVIQRVQSLAGLEVTAVDITITDLAPNPPSS